MDAGSTDRQAQPRVLVVDDERVQRLIVGGIAARAGLAVAEAESVQQARGLLADQHFNVVVLDLSLREGDGIELLRVLYESGSDPVLIFMSGFDERVREAAARLASALGLRVAGTLAKPIDRNRLMAMLGDLPQREVQSAATPSTPVTPQALEAAIESGDLFCLYQPKLRLADRRIIGVEVLARWRTKAGEIIPPNLFIPVAEEHGLIGKLTWCILEQAAAALEAMLWINPELTMAVNFSPSSLIDLDIPAQIVALLERYAIPAEAVVVEVTESAVMAEFVTAAEILTRLRIRGVKVSIDDFGTGHSSLLSLLRLPFNELKIDQSFVRGLRHDPEMPKLVRAVLRMCQELGLTVVAEGVETEEIAEILQELGCTVVQGYLFGRPMSAEDVSVRLTEDQQRAAA
jgi:EAL domain-containing protein (putative c-di-GMP-specific phosphodiesterase class I)/ActR/RegA family two-component response regulator